MSATDNKSAGLITARAIESKIKKSKRSGSEIWLSDPAPRGAGRLKVRCSSSGAQLYFRYARDGQRDVLPIGVYDEDGTAGLTLVQAREKAGELSRLYQSGTRDLRSHLQAQDEQQKATRKAEAQQRLQDEAGSLEALCLAYGDYLSGRPSQRDVRGLLRLHVIEAHPALAAQAARGVKAEEFTKVPARLIEQGKGRTAGKVRSYLRTAYALALRAKFDPKVRGRFHSFEIESNPLDRLPALDEYNRARDRSLTHAELVEFYRRMVLLPPTAAADALRCCLLLGGQRGTQLPRMTAKDVDLADRMLVIRDFKGRKRHITPRLHWLPIPEELVPVLKRRLLVAEPWVFSTAGDVPIRQETIAAVVSAIAAEMDCPPFTLGDLRRTAETHLAALGISKDIRAQLQSHGLSGVQHKHYDRYEYRDEKLAAMRALINRMRGSDPKNVRPIRAAR